MRSIRTSTALALSAVLLLTCTAFDCEKKTPEEQKAQFIAYAKDIRNSVIAASPLIAKLKPQLVPAWNRAIDISGQMISAVEHSDKVTVSALLVELVPIFTDVIDQFTDNQNVLIALALGNIALSFFVNHYLSESASSGGPKRASTRGENKVVEFARRPRWKCRDAVHGVYRKMEFCVAHPSSSTVETR